MTDLLLNIGCGLHAPAGWLNLDRSPNLLLDRVPLVKTLLRRAGVLTEAHMAQWPRNVRRVDITKGLPFPDDSVAAIYSSHTLEHIHYASAIEVLRECRRVLRPGGVCRLALPDADRWARDLVDGICEELDDPGLEFNQRLLAFPLVKPTLRSRTVELFGASHHFWQPTRTLVNRMLREAGFSDAVERRFLEGELPSIPEVEHRPESIFYEARA